MATALESESESAVAAAIHPAPVADYAADTHPPVPDYAACIRKDSCDSDSCSILKRTASEPGAWAPDVDGFGVVPAAGVAPAF